MNGVMIHKISRTELYQLSEEQLMFITNPGRMGDEDGVTFIMRQDNEFTIYRVDGLLYPNEDNTIILGDLEKHFSKWFDTWKHSSDNNFNGKYKYLYMGFGNGLCIDYSIYKEFELYLNNLVDKYLEKCVDDDKEKYRYSAIFNVWEDAFIDMVSDRGYVIK